MGLHLNYELRLPASATVEAVENVLVRLRDFALALPFKSVTEIYRPEPGRCDSRRGGLRLLASVIAKVLIADIDLVRGFSIIPGNGCESAAFAFMPRADQRGKHTDWFWYSSCKTQYASVISDAHLVACHGGLVKVLDHAIALGVNVVVRDETRYWDTRDEQRLITEVHNMNRIVAALAGKVSDHAGVANGRVQAPIFGGIVGAQHAAPLPIGR